MLHLLRRFARRLIQRNSGRGREITPDEIFLDSSNLPRFDRHQFEGRFEKPISRRVILALGLFFCALLAVFLARIFVLQVERGDDYVRRGEQNRLRHTLVFGERGAFFDRIGEEVAWNVFDEHEQEFSKRRYSPRLGIAHVLGFLKYPSKDSAGFYYKVDFEGMDGVEKDLNEYVAPEHGLKIVETDAFGAVQSESVFKRPKDGAEVILSIDAALSEKLYEFIKTLAVEKRFDGGAAVIMDVENGEILALVSFPEYDPQILTDGANAAAIARLVNDAQKPFLNRVTLGLYAPGSIVKPFIALAALEEGIISPEKEIVSTGSISVPNPFDSAKPSVFKDWKAHGAVDMRRALAVSSDVYFYEIGGGLSAVAAAQAGFKEQRGLGIERIEKYMRMFGFGESAGGNIPNAAGVIPTPKWKLENFSGESWRLGNTYHTAIGQYGFQVTPLQAVVAAAALANNGKILEPRLVRDETDPSAYRLIPAKAESFAVVREGMRQAVLVGTASGLNIPYVSVAAKTGTAELGVSKNLVNSWVVGFFPYERPKYAFAVLMEKGPRENTVGALFVARQFLEWIGANKIEYLKESL